MPDGSPIDQWWKSHRPVEVSTNAKTATHLALSGRVAYCGHRKGFATHDHALVTCSACLAALRADQQSRGE